jgi:hypothetical protein
MHTFLKILTVAFIGFFVVGCAMPKPKTQAELISASSDKLLTKNISESLKDEKYRISYDNNLIRVTQYISGEKGHMDGHMNEALSDYYKIYDSSRDKITQVFLDTAKQRGNTVKLYKKQLNNYIAQNFFSNYDKQYKQCYGEADVAFIEFDKSNRIFSLLARGHTFEKGLALMHHRYSLYIFGTKAASLESVIPNSMFSDYYTTTLVGGEEPEKQGSVDNSSSTKAEKLKEFYELYKSGAISKEEYEKEKNTILKEKKSAEIKPQTVSVQSPAAPFNLNSIFLNQYNSKYGTHFTTMEEMQQDMVKRNSN